MFFDRLFDVDGEAAQRRADKLEIYHRRRIAPLLWVLLIGLVTFVVWSNHFVLDQVARAAGEVVAQSRVQIIQAVDGGVLEELTVSEGDTVKAGEVLARFAQQRIAASYKEVEASLCALKIQRARLLAEVTSAGEPAFPAGTRCSQEQVQLERALFHQRRSGLADELANLQTAVGLAQEESTLVGNLVSSGDANRAEVLRTARLLNDAESKLIQRKNSFYEDANSELTVVEDKIAQSEQKLNQQRQQLEDSVFVAPMDGIVKNVRITTVGGVLRSGEELMEIVPTGDKLIVEAKVSPVDIALVRPGLPATLRFDPFDYTIYGGVKGVVRYVSADTLKEETRHGEETYYRVHISIDSNPATTTTGNELDILPGMTAQVDIRTGERTVMEYLLKPLRKTLSTAFGER